jgi:DNA-binding response OmpR family regulator
MKHPQLASPSVLVVEDDSDWSKTLCLSLEHSGMKVSVAPTGGEAIRLAGLSHHDVVVLDLGLPDIDGSKLITWLRAKTSCGVIIISGRAEVIDRIVAIELGADDYLVKPSIMREIVARINAVHRRLSHLSWSPIDCAHDAINLRGVRVDLARRIVQDRNGEPIHLTSAEFTVLAALIEATPEPVSRERLCCLALRRPFHAEDRGVDQLILNLRHKMFGKASPNDVIVSVRAAGYSIFVDHTALGSEKLVA